MAIDFITDTPNRSPTEGLDLQAPSTQFTPSSPFIDTLGQGIGDATGRAIRGISSFVSKYGVDDPEYGQIAPEARLPIDEAKKKYPGVKGIDEPLPETVIQNMQKQQQNDAKLADIQARYPKGIVSGAEQLGAGAIAGLLDPVADAAFMVPVVGEARYAGWLAKAGESAGMVGRGAVTAGVGAARGAGGGAILGGIEAGLDPNMTLGDVATETLQSAAAGALFHSAFSFRSDIMGRRFAESPEGHAAFWNAYLHDDATRVAAAQMAADHPIEVRPVFDAAKSSAERLQDAMAAARGEAPSFRSSLEGSTAMDRAQAVYTDDAVARAAGRPTQEAALAEDMSRQARETTPEQVTKGQLAEIDRAIAELRGSGYLTAEEEAELAHYEPKPEAKPSEDETKVATVQGEQQAAQAEGQPLKIVPMEGAELPGGGVPDVLGDKVAHMSEDEMGRGQGHPEWGSLAERVVKDAEDASISHAVTLKDGTSAKLVNYHDGDGGGRAFLVADGKVVGDLSYALTEYAPGKGFNPDVHIADEFRRKGAATALYDAAEKSGAKIPDLHQEGQVRTPEGQAFREARGTKHFKPQAHEGGPAFESLRDEEEAPLSPGREHVENVRDDEFTRALNREYFRQGNPDQEPWEPKRPVMVARLRKLVADVRDGKLTDEQVRAHIEDLHAHAEARIANRLVREVPERERGADYIRQRLLEAKRRGDISEETSDFAEWLVQRNPEMLDELGISVRQAPEGEGRAAGNYNPLNRVMTLFKGVAADGTAVHEMLHHLERMMPPEIQAAIRAEWSRGVTEGLRSEDPAVRGFFEAVLKANTSGQAADFEEALSKLGNRADYQYLNPSEFWAENTTRILSSQYASQGSLGARIAQWMREMIQHAKAVLGLRSDAPMLRALNDLLSRGSGEVGEGDAGSLLTRGARFNDLSQDQMDAMAMAKQRATIAMNIIKKKALGDKIDDLKSKGLTLAQGFDALTRGISHAVEGARDSTAQRQVAHQEFLMGRLVGNLDRIPGAMEAWRGQSMTADWVRELYELNKKDGQPGLTKSPMALEIAKAVHDAQDIARLNLNRSGAWVGDYDGYIAKTLHDAYKIHSAGFETWKNAVLSGIDQAKTFADLSAPEREKFLSNMWDALSTGVHMTADHGEAVKAVAFPGRGDIARRASSGRVLHWKDADSWRAYQEQFGEPSIEKGVLTSLYRSGRDAALMERWGTNPNATFETLIRQTKEKYRNDHEATLALDKALPRLREEFAHLTGEASRPQSDLASRIRGSVLAMQDITKLGNVLLAHLSTSLTKPFQLQYLGVGRWKAYTSVLTNLMKDDSPEGKQLLENLRANATGQYQEMIGGYEPLDSVPGQIARIRQFSMRIGGLPWMLGRQKAGTTWELANFLGHNLDKTFDQLDKRTARGLKIYGVTPAEWEALCTAPDHDKDGEGSVYLTPKAAMRADVDGLAADRLSNATDAADADRIREETRSDLAMKLASYYSDAAARSTVTPGIQERAFFTRHAGRTWGPAVGQYKGWAMAAVRTMWGQSIYGSSSKAEAVKYLAELMAVGTAIGYARSAITDASKGMVPETFKGDPKHDAILLSKSMVAGGAMGIFGDYLMSQYSRAGESSSDRAKDLAANIMGPAFSDIAQTYGLAKEFASVPFSDDAMHALSKADADGERFITSHLPVVNTFYLRALSHWLFVDRLNEAADPGYLQRHQDAVKERTGQQFYLPPTQYAGAPQ